MELFAQQQGAGAGAVFAIMAAYLLVIAIFVVIGLAVHIFFLLTMSRCLNEVSRRNRQMEPGQVWLCLIPLFGFVWTIIMMIRIADSLKDEYYDRDLPGDGDFGKTLGIIYLVSAWFCGPVCLVCFIMYWVKIAGYTKTLKDEPGDYDDDDDDDRPRSRRRDDDDDDDDRRRGRRDDDDDDDRPRRR